MCPTFLLLLGTRQRQRSCCRRLLLPSPSCCILQYLEHAFLNHLHQLLVIKLPNHPYEISQRQLILCGTRPLLLLIVFLTLLPSSLLVLFSNFEDSRIKAWQSGLIVQ
jgi:hypothetical protein